MKRQILEWLETFNGKINEEEIEQVPTSEEEQNTAVAPDKAVQKPEAPVAEEPQIDQSKIDEVPDSGEKKETFGRQGSDDYFSMVTKYTSDGVVEDIIILDAEDKQVFSAKESGLDLKNMADVISQAANKVNVTSLDMNIVEKYLTSKEEDEEPQENAEKMEQEETNTEDLEASEEQETEEQQVPESKQVNEDEQPVEEPVADDTKVKPEVPAVEPTDPVQETDIFAEMNAGKEIELTAEEAKKVSNTGKYALWTVPGNDQIFGGTLETWASKFLNSKVTEAELSPDEFKKVKDILLAPKETPSAISGNAKTGISVDFSTNCRFRKEGHACLYCYVEIGRQKVDSFIKKLVDQGWTAEDFKSAQETGKYPKEAEVAGKSKEVGDRFVKPAPVKALFDNAKYNGEFLKYTQDRVKQENAKGGIRLYANSDYGSTPDQAEEDAQLQRLFDDADKVGLKVKAITKNPEFIRKWSNRTAVTNFSVDELGKSGVPTNAMPLEDAIKLTSPYDKAKIRIVAFNPEEAIKYAQNPKIGIVTLFHGGVNQLPKDMTEKVKVVNMAKGTHEYEQVKNAIFNLKSDIDPMYGKKLWYHKFCYTTAEACATCPVGCGAHQPASTKKVKELGNMKENKLYEGYSTHEISKEEFLKLMNDGYKAVSASNEDLLSNPDLEVMTSFEMSDENPPRLFASDNTGLFVEMEKEATAESAPVVPPAPVVPTNEGAYDAMKQQAGNRVIISWKVKNSDNPIGVMTSHFSSVEEFLDYMKSQNKPIEWYQVGGGEKILVNEGKLPSNASEVDDKTMGQLTETDKSIEQAFEMLGQSNNTEQPLVSPDVDSVIEQMILGKESA